MSDYYDPPEDNSRCDICGRATSDCECPECPVCGEVGRVECLVDHGLTVEGITLDNIMARKHQEGLNAEAESAEMEQLSIEADRITQEGREYAEQRAEEQAVAQATPNDWDDLAYDAYRERMMRRR